MLYSKLDKNSKVTQSLIIDSPVILHFIPDLNTNILNFIDDLNINLNNLQGILIKSELIKLSSSFVNTKNYLNQLKSEIQDHRRVTIYNITPSNIGKSKFLIYDHSPIVNLVSMYNDINIKKSTEFLLQHIKDTNIDLKLKFPSFENVPIFYVKDGNGIIRNLKYIKNFISLNFFDKYALVNCEDTIFNLASFDSSGKIEVNTTNISNVEGKLKNIKINLNPVVKDNLDKITKKVEINTDPVNNKLDINVEKLSQSLNSLNITDKTVLDNFKSAITKNINNSPSEINDEDLSIEILKSANKTIFNKASVNNLYKNDPNRLLVKLQNVNNFKKTIEFPKSKQIRLLDPASLVKIRDITGPVRHQYEFSENIDFNVEKLFRVLETKSNPIQVINISKDIKDNDLERYSEYTITLKNTSEKGLQGPYDIKLKLPSLINEKYFKLNGKEYIISSQQFLNPITKDKPNEVRFLTNYNMIRLKLKNLKYTPNQIENILNLINNKYSKYVANYENNNILFKNGSRINLNNPEQIYTSDINPQAPGIVDLRLVNGKYVVFKDNKSTNNSVLKNEYLFERLHEIIPELNLKIANKSVQYIQCYVMGAWLPVIVYFWSQLGLIETLLRFNLDYSIGNTPDSKFKNNVRLELADSSLFVYPENKREEYIANGLLLLQKYLTNIKSEDLQDKDSSYEYLYTEFGGNIIEKFDNAMENMIDPITQDLLEFEDQPSNLLDNLSGPCIDKLFNDEPDHPSDLSTLRSRQSEYLMHLLFNEIDNYSLHS